MASAPISGMMAVNIRVTGKRIKFQALVYTLGLMADDTKVNGSKIIWRASVSTFGTMGASTRAATKTTRNTGMEFINGLIIDVMRATGTGVNSMVWALITCRKRTE